MGTYTDLTVMGYPLVESKSEVIPEIMTIFQERDRRQFSRRVSERNQLVWGKPDKESADHTEPAVEYSCSVKHAMERLNVMGFTLRRARAEFEQGVMEKLQEYDEWAADGENTRWFANDRKFLRTLTFDGYKNALGKVIENSLRPSPFQDYKKRGLDPIVKYILKDHDESYFGYFGSDFRCLIRVACEVVPADSLVVQDISALVEAGYYQADERVCEIATQGLLANHPENAPRIVLTEGSTDASILREALTLLFPHLAGYYSFMDFESSRSQGGAGHLVSLVKAFSGARVTNRIIALFDNDTAARDATRMLDKASLPPNIAVRHYPDLDSLRKYPTLGPAGAALEDVNRRAASLELYFGRDILTDERGELSPVQWKGYVDGLRQFQGEVTRKSQLRADLLRKIARCKEDPAALNATDWSGLSAILQDVFHAFDS